MARKQSKWAPKPRTYASYTGSSSPLLRSAGLIEVVAEASGSRMVVRAIGRRGKPVQFCVAAKNLAQPQPDFFN